MCSILCLALSSKLRMKLGHSGKENGPDLRLDLGFKAHKATQSSSTCNLQQHTNIYQSDCRKSGSMRRPELITERRPYKGFSRRLYLLLAPSPASHDQGRSRLRGPDSAGPTRVAYAKFSHHCTPAPLFVKVVNSWSAAPITLSRPAANY